MEKQVEKEFKKMYDGSISAEDRMEMINQLICPECKKTLKKINHSIFCEKCHKVKKYV